MDRLISENEDCVSRANLISKLEILEKRYGSDFYWETRKIVDKLPSVNPQPKTGHWIKISPAGIYECSECGQNVMTSDICAYKFCHGCGARMVEPQETKQPEISSYYGLKSYVRERSE